MRWYERLYLGERAQKKRFQILQSLREGKNSGYYVLTLPSNEKNLLDIYSAATIQQPYYKNNDNILIVGVASDYEDAAMLVGKIVGNVYNKTGGYHVSDYLKEEMARKDD